MSPRHAVPVPPLLIITPHEPSEWCADVHCYSHSVDEDTTGAYIVCFECGHVYKTRRSLTWAYRKEFWRVSSPHSLPAAPDGVWGAPATRGPAFAERLWHVLTIRASKIPFCQECMHDF